MLSVGNAECRQAAMHLNENSGRRGATGVEVPCTLRRIPSVFTAIIASLCASVHAASLELLPGRWQSSLARELPSGGSQG
jgi:hypothetical protein